MNLLKLSGTFTRFVCKFFRNYKKPQVLFAKSHKPSETFCKLNKTLGRKPWKTFS